MLLVEKLLRKDADPNTIRWEVVRIVIELKIQTVQVCCYCLDTSSKCGLQSDDSCSQRLCNDG